MLIQNNQAANCAIYDHRALRPYWKIASFEYFECTSCHALIIDPQVISAIDAGKPRRLHNSGYWKSELNAARERAYGACLARMAEAIHYVQMPVRKFLDIGTWPGYFLDAVERYLPGSAKIFYGVEKFPTPPEYGSVFIGIATSERSENVLQAFAAAKELGLFTLALCGESRLANGMICDHLRACPSKVTARIQECHIIVPHFLCDLVESALFKGES